ncbi:Mobile element protein (plasmid) [Cupriavidus necator H850]|nr:Mobile element protein [Cupriavidus necator H850]
MRYISQQNKNPKPIKWKYDDPIAAGPSSAISD